LSRVRGKIDISKIKKAVRKEFSETGSKTEIVQKVGREYIKTGISGFDALFEIGIPRGSTVLVAGGPGSGKTTLCLHIMINAARANRKCLYMSFEESEERLFQHMEDFGWVPRAVDKNNLLIRRFSSFDISKAIDAMLAKQKGELMIDFEPIILPKGFVPDFVIVDSVSSISSNFVGREESYRSYIEHLFRFFEEKGSTTFLISETDQNTVSYSRTGVEEFLADGVIALYNIRRGDVREMALEVIKMRGTKHKKKLVATKVVGGVGMEVYPEQEVFGATEVKQIG
jgi:circadian clock protein KaiC